MITTTWYFVLVFLMMNTFQNPIAGLLDEEINIMRSNPKEQISDHCFTRLERIEVHEQVKMG